jgi:hypothetical protein
VKRKRDELETKKRDKAERKLQKVGGLKESDRKGDKVDNLDDVDDDEDDDEDDDR